MCQPQAGSEVWLLQVVVSPEVHTVLFIFFPSTSKEAKYSYPDFTECQLPSSLLATAANEALMGGEDLVGAS